MIELIDSLQIQNRKQNVSRDAFNTLEEMKAFNENYLPDVFISVCYEDGIVYIFNRNNEVLETTGKWRKLTDMDFDDIAKQINYWKAGMDEETCKKSILTLIDSAVSVLESKVDADYAELEALISDTNVVIDSEIQRAKNSENTLNSKIDTTKSELTSSISAAKTELQSSIDSARDYTSDLVQAEFSRANVKETTLNTKIDNEITRSTNKDDELSGIIDNEITRSVNKDTELNNKIDDEITRSTNKDSEISSSIESETTRATTKESEIASNIQSETTRATTKENELNTKIESEVTRATGKESELDKKIDDEVTRATTKDTEIIKSVSDEVTRATGVESTLSTSISDETTRATTKENELDNKIDNEITRATTAETTLRNDVFNSKGVANGFATLDENGKLKSTQLPVSAISIVGYLNASVTHVLPDATLYEPGSEIIVIADGFYVASTAFTLLAGRMLTDLEVIQANLLISYGYVFTLYREDEVLGLVSTFANDSVTLTDGTVITLPDEHNLSATSIPDSVQIPVAIGDILIQIDGHWIHLANKNSVVSVNGMTGAVVLAGSNLPYDEDKTINQKIDTKQDTLESGTTIKTIHGKSILGSGNIELNKSDVGLTNVDNTSDNDKPISSATQIALNGKVDKIEGKGLSTNDYDSIEKSNVASNTSARHTHDNKTFIDKIGEDESGAMTYNGSSVGSVKGVKGESETDYRSGNVNITKENIGLGNVNNTSDADKPISTATSTELAKKVDKVDGYGLSKNDLTDILKASYDAAVTNSHTHTNKEILDAITEAFTTALKNKLDGIDEGANKVEESTVSGWGFTKNTGTYSKPADGIPKTDLTSEVQDSLNLADSAIQTETTLSLGETTGSGNAITSLSVNGHEITQIKGSTFLTEHQDISGKLDISGSNGTSDGVSTLINKLPTGDSDPVDNDYYVAQYANGGTKNTAYYRRPVSKLWNYIKSKADSIYAALTHTHVKADITDFPSSLPANGGSADTSTLWKIHTASSTLTTDKSSWMNGQSGTIVYGQCWKNTSLGNDTGDITFFLKQLSNAVTLNMNIDGNIKANEGFTGRSLSLNDKVVQTYDSTYNCLNFTFK